MDSNASAYVLSNSPISPSFTPPWSPISPPDSPSSPPAWLKESLLPDAPSRRCMRRNRMFPPRAGLRKQQPACYLAVSSSHRQHVEKNNNNGVQHSVSPTPVHYLQGDLWTTVLGFLWETTRGERWRWRQILCLRGVCKLLKQLIDSKMPWWWKAQAFLSSIAKCNSRLVYVPVDEFTRDNFYSVCWIVSQRQDGPRCTFDGYGATDAFDSCKNFAQIVGERLLQCLEQSRCVWRNDCRKCELCDNGRELVCNKLDFVCHAARAAFPTKDKYYGFLFECLSSLASAVFGSGCQRLLDEWHRWANLLLVCRDSSLSPMLLYNRGFVQPSTMDSILAFEPSRGSVWVCRWMLQLLEVLPSSIYSHKGTLEFAHTAFVYAACWCEDRSILSAFLGLGLITLDTECWDVKRVVDRHCCKVDRLTTQIRPSTKPMMYFICSRGRSFTLEYILSHFTKTQIMSSMQGGDAESVVHVAVEHSYYHVVQLLVSRYEFDYSAQSLAAAAKFKDDGIFRLFKDRFERFQHTALQAMLLLRDVELNDKVTDTEGQLICLWAIENILRALAAKNACALSQNIEAFRMRSKNTWTMNKPYDVLYLQPTIYATYRALLKKYRKEPFCSLDSTRACQRPVVF